MRIAGATGLVGTDGVCEQAVNGTHGTIKGKLSHGQGLLDTSRVNLSRCKKICDRDRQIEAGATLAHGGRSQVDNHVAGRHIETGRPHGTSHPQTCLLHGRIGHADDVPARQPRPDLDLNRDGNGLDTVEGAGGDAGAYGPRSTH